MAEINIDKIYIPSEDVVARLIEGELIIVPLVAGIGDMDDELFTLNETGKAIWENLDGKNNLRDVVGALSREYDAEADLIQNDVLGLVKELVTRRMLVEQSAL
jgi:hypothetical protein